MAKVTKILETTLAAGATAAIFNDADIPNSLIRIFATNSNIYPQSISLTGTTLTVTYEEQDASMGVAIELTKQGLDIIDNLTSSDDAAALSAKQGKALKDAIDALPTPPEDITDLSDVLITDIEDGQVLAWDDSEQKFVNVDQSGGGTELTIYPTSWIASTSSAEKTKLCDDVDLPAGTYIAVIHTPYTASNVANFIYSIVADNSYISYCTIIGDTNYKTYILMFTLDSTTNIYFSAGTNASASWDAQYMEDEGYANYIKIG